MLEREINNLNLTKIKSEYKESIFFGFLGNLNSPHTQLAYKRDLEVFAEYLKAEWPGVTFLSVIHEHVVAYRLFLQQFGGRGKSKASAKTVNRRLSSLKKFYRFLCQRKILEKNPLEFIDLIKMDSRVKTEAITYDQWKKLMEGKPRPSFTESLHQAIVAMLFTTGMRKSELLSLKLKSLQKKDNFYLIEYTAKGSKVLRKPLHELCVYHLLKYLQICKDQGFSFNPDAALFRGTKERERTIGEDRLHPSTLDYIIEKAGKKISLTQEKLHPHMARATVITLLYQQGADLKRIQDYVGHSHSKMTSEYIKKSADIDESPVFLL